MRTEGILRKIFIAVITGVIVGFCYVAGYFLENNGSLDLGNMRFYVYWVTMSLLAGLFVMILWKGLELWGMGKYKVPWKEKKWYQKIQKFSLPLWGYVLILLVCWLPVWLSIFPGAFSYDAPDELRQIAQNDINAHHPVIHVLWLGGLTEGAYQLTGSYNLGVAIYTFMQMVLLASAFGYTISVLEEWGAKGVGKILALLFYGLSPVIQLFAIAATKDILFAAAALIFFLSVLRMTQKTDIFFGKTKWKMVFILSTLFTMILRNNGLYVVILTLLGLIVYLKNYRKNLLKLVLIVVIPYIIYVGPVYHLLGVRAGGVEEMLSVPLQQIARVHYYEKEAFTSEELELIYEIIPKENWDAYRSGVADFVKSGFRKDAFDERRGEFLKLWLRLGVENPAIYINSFLLGTVDLWYPHAIVDGYMDVYGRSSYYDYQVCEPATEIVLLPKLHEMYEYLSVDKEAQRIPGIFLIISQGWYLIIAMILFAYLWQRKEYGKMVPMMILVWNTATVLLGPIALVRYVLILFYVFPVLPFLIIKKSDE